MVCVLRRMTCLTLLAIPFSTWWRWSWCSWGVPNASRTPTCGQSWQTCWPLSFPHARNQQAFLLSKRFLFSAWIWVISGLKHSKQHSCVCVCVCERERERFEKKEAIYQVYCTVWQVGRYIYIHFSFWNSTEDELHSSLYVCMLTSTLPSYFTGHNSNCPTRQN